jgi:lysophospholipase L1-like esterase
MLLRLARGLGLSFAGVVAGLVVAEFVARVLDGAPLLPILPPAPYIDNEILYRESPTRRYELRPDVDQTVGVVPVHIHINAAGFRDDDEVPLSKPAGTRRIALLGDSFTFAGKVRFEDTLGERLERLLEGADPSHRFAVLNFGVAGYNTEQESVQLEEQVLAFDPDLVIVAYFLNDATPTAQLFPKHPRFPLAARLVLKRSYLVQLLYRRSKIIEAKWRGALLGTARDYPELAEGSPGWDRSKAALAAIRDTAARHGAAVLVMMWPMFVDLDDSYPLRDKHELVGKACAKLGIPFLDLLTAFLGRDCRSLWVSADDMHPNADAQEIAAQAVFAELRRERWLR